MITVNYLRYDTESKCTELIGSSLQRKTGKPIDVLETWANTYGLGITGSQAAFQNRLFIRQKIPVLIDPFRQIYFFPTVTSSSPDCLWINASHIKSIKATALGSEIRFLDTTVMHLGIGRRSLMKQWKRCQQMEHLILRSRLEETGPGPILLP